jgi:hypothetical protein
MNWVPQKSELQNQSQTICCILQSSYQQYLSFEKLEQGSGETAKEGMAGPMINTMIFAFLPTQILHLIKSKLSN